MSAALTPEQEQALDRLPRAWPERSMVLIGAAALGMHLSMVWRRTADLDLTVIADAASVTAHLHAPGVSAPPQARAPLATPGSVVRLDVLTATEADLERGHLVFAESEHLMNLAGFDLVLRHGQAHVLGSDLSTEVARVPVFALLKMATWCAGAAQLRVPALGSVTLREGLCCVRAMTSIA